MIEGPGSYLKEINENFIPSITHFPGNLPSVQYILALQKAGKDIFSGIIWNQIRVYSRTV